MVSSDSSVVRHARASETRRSTDERPIDSPVDWYASALCTGGTCVFYCIVGALITIIDSKQGTDSTTQPSITVDVEAFECLKRELIGLRPAGSNGHVVVDHLADGWVALRSLDTGVSLHFDSDEYQAFVAGIDQDAFALVGA